MWEYGAGAEGGVARECNLAVGSTSLSRPRRAQCLPDPAVPNVPRYQTQPVFTMLQRTKTGTWLPAWVPSSSVVLSILLIFCSMVQSATGNHKPLWKHGQVLIRSV